MADFYSDTLTRLVRSKLLDPSASTLVVAGGLADRSALLGAQFANVTISNLDRRTHATEFEPYRWSFQDAENLDFPDGAFEQVVVHAGLHHCSSPHRGLLEMYRVASKSVVVFEARDSFAMRLAISLGLTVDYEVEAVVGNDMAYGGIRNTEVPNFVYRWSEREVAKTLSSYDPTGPIPLRYFYGLRMPTERLRMGRSKWKRALAALLAFPANALFTLAPKQGNEFAFWAGKPAALWPWIADQNPRAFNREWAHKRYIAPR